MKLNHFIKIFALMVFCSTFFVSEGKSYVPDQKSKHVSFSHKLSPSDSFPENAYVTINLLEGNQEITQQVHKTTTSSHIAYLPPRTFNVYIKCINFFSKFNDQRYTLLNKVFLFPFHAFW